MQLLVIQRILGLLLVIFSSTQIPPMLVSVIYLDGAFEAFFDTFAITLITGIVLWLPVKNRKRELRLRDGFVIVVLFWSVLGLFGAIPLFLSEQPSVSLTDAVFEAISGLTTTGATVLTGLDTLPKSILYYRQQLQWLGGMGIIILAVAILPMLGIGGMQLYRAEMPGPVKDERMTPRIAQTARMFSVLYVGMTGACALSYWLAGMNAFDAIAHSMTTLSTGGYSTHDASIAFFDSAAIETVAVVFMLLGGISFNVHLVAWQTLTPAHYGRSDQVRAFLLATLVLIVIVAAVLMYGGAQYPLLDAVRNAAFEVSSVVTSTGYGIADFSIWPGALPVILIFSSFMGGCAGSTAGGMKVIRFVILARQAGVYIKKLIHPRLVRPIRMDGRVVPSEVVDGVWGFFTIYVVLFGFLMIVLMTLGMDQVTAFGAVATCLNNLGPGLGDVATTFADVSEAAKLVLVVAMILGRLEIFTILVLLAPSFWKG